MFSEYQMQDNDIMFPEYWIHDKEMMDAKVNAVQF